MTPERTIFRVQYQRLESGWSLLMGKDAVITQIATKHQAVNVGREMAKRFQPSQLVIHLKNGRIQTNQVQGEP